MQALIDFILANLRALNPLFVVRSGQNAVVFRFGVDVDVKGPGFHWRVPFRDIIEKVSVVPDVSNLLTQSVTTKDGHSVTFSANIAYEVVDPRARLTRVQDFEASMQGIAMGHLAQRVRSKTLPDLVADQADLERSLRGTMTTRVKAWGVQINDVALTDLVVARQYRVFSDAPFVG